MPSGVYNHKKGNHPSTEFKKGDKHTEEWKKTHSERMSGAKNPAWKGGITKNINEYTKNRYKKLPQHKKDAISWSNNKRNRNKRILNKNGSFHTFGEWENLKAQYNWTCPCCKKSEPEIKLTEDHIVPLSKGGSDNIENIQPLCRHCNFKKHTNIVKYNKLK